MHVLVLPLLIQFLLPSMTGNLITKPEYLWDQHQFNKVKETKRIDNVSSSKPFLPFFDLGAPAGPAKGNITFNPPVYNDIHNSLENGIYTTLDKLQKPSLKKMTTLKKFDENLGGLTPEEIFYIDKDIVIIKGGDFQDSAYEKARLISKKKIQDQSVKALKKLSSTNTQEKHFDDKNSFTQPFQSPLQLQTSQLSLFLPSALPEQSRRYYHFIYHPSNIHNYSYSPPRESFYPPLLRTSLSGKFIQAPSLNNLNNKHISPFYSKSPKKHSNIFSPFSINHSLMRDIDINYRFPLPSLHPDAEWLAIPRIKRE